ncbi:MAG: hypothetical protein U1C97_00920 [Candidatus Gracilibacteria bacterium]|nr:hypothetical protein [bacterium]MDZ4216863.1 hypothetical protein [Candidatus Gracilibacteria bacterium]
MPITFPIGILGGLILVIGAAYPDKPVRHPVQSTRNWLLSIGGLLMLTYSILNYLEGGPVFFIFLQGLINIASIFMMSNAPEKISTPIIVVSGMSLIVWSLSLFEGINTFFFIIGLSGIALGYVLKPGTFRRNLALFTGSVLIAVFSYIEASWIFFWLNVFFAIFSGYYSWKLWK